IPLLQRVRLGEFAERAIDLHVHGGYRRAEGAQIVQPLAGPLIVPFRLSAQHGHRGRETVPGHQVAGMRGDGSKPTRMTNRPRTEAAIAATMSSWRRAQSCAIRLSATTLSAAIPRNVHAD